MSVHHYDFTIERRFRQRPEQTFHAFGDPDLRGRWFRVPDNWTEAEWSLDFRVGGGELNAGRDDGGTHHLFRSRFHDIVDGERIVFAYDMVVDGRLASVSLGTIELQPDDGGGTHLFFTEHGAFLDGLEDPAAREHGAHLLLDELEAFLVSEVAA